MKKIIAIRMPNWIGDAVMATPVLEYTKTIFPNSYLIIVTKKWTLPVFKNNPYIDDFFILPNDISKTPLKFFNISKKLKKKYKIDLYISLPNSLSTALFGFLIGAKKRLGYKKEGRGFFLTKSLIPPSNVHRTDKYLYLVKSLQLKEISLQIKIYPSPLPTGIKELINILNLKKGYIGINPNSMAESRRWAPERFAELIKELKKRKFRKLPIVLFGSKKEEDYVNSINFNSNNQAFNLAGKITLEEYIQILQYSKIFITNDSGPMHLAFALNKPVIDLCGAANIQETGNYNKNNKTFYINKNVECSPCVLNKCPNKGLRYKQCMTAIEVKDIIDTLKNFLLT